MEKLYKWIAISDRFSRMYLDQKFKPLGVNSSQHMYIIHICEVEGISQDKLVNKVFINKSNVTRALAQLEKKGFIVKQQNPRDKRTSLLHPTDKARRIYPEIIRIEEEWVDMITTALSDDDKNRLLELMKNIAGSAVAMVREVASPANRSNLPE